MRYYSVMLNETNVTFRIDYTYFIYKNTKGRLVTTNNMYLGTKRQNRNDPKISVNL